MSPYFARMAKEVYGYKNVKYLVEGHMSWQAGINPYYTEPEFLKLAQDEGISHVLVDVRSTEKARREHIKGAVNYPISAMEDLFQNLPADKKTTRIIYYSDNETDAVLAHRTMRANGYENGYILNNGIAGWKAKGYPVVKDQLQTEIPAKLAVTPLPGAMSIADYEKVVQTRPEDTVIVDVRSPGEFMKSMVPGAITMPIDTMDKRWKELPTDKKLVIQCEAGNRALMAWRVLVNNGVKDVKWVDGHISKFSKGILQEGAYGR